jgi:O-antigen/teichoic acid export membrane protein
MSDPRLFSIVVAISLAYAWHSYWALLCAIETGIVLRIAMGYAMHPFRPRLRLTEWRRIAGFSFWSWLLSLGGLLSERCPSFVIGRVFNLTQVGVFAVGAEIAALPTTELISPLSRVSFSGFASAREKSETGAVFLRMVGATALLALPAGVGISLVADPIVKLAFGASWDGATSVIQILGVAFAATIFGYICSALLNAHALLQSMFWIQGVSLAVRFLLLLFLVAPFGLSGAAIAVGVATIVEHALHLIWTVRYLRIPASEVLRVTWRPLVGVAVMAGGLALLGLGWNRIDGDLASAIWDLALAVPLGALLYAVATAACWFLMGCPEGAERDIAGLFKRFSFWVRY